MQKEKNFVLIVFTTAFVVEENSLEKRYILLYKRLSPQLLSVFFFVTPDKMCPNQSYWTLE